MCRISAVRGAIAHPVKICWLVWIITHTLVASQDKFAPPGVQPLGIIGFDCNTTSLDVVTYDLNRVEECIPSENITSTQEHINVQVLQKKDLDALMVRRCHVITQMLMWHCGMHSHTTLANFDFSPYPMTLTRAECQEAHNTGRLVLHGKVYDHLQGNHTTIFSTTRVGSVWGEGQCEGGNLEYRGYTYKNVVVKQSYQISLYDRLYFFKTGSQEITAFNGLSCKLADSSCYDFEVGRVYWESPRHECRVSLYESLYEGRAELVHTTKLGPNEKYIRITALSDASFQLFTPLLRYESLCGLDGWATPYHGLYIAQYQDTPPFPIIRPLVPNLDLFRYIETKFLTFAFGSAMDISGLIKRLSDAQCRSHREALLNRLHIISATPSSANLLVGNKPGVYGRVAGEVVHILQCPPVQVTLRRATTCTLEIPVLVEGKPLYMDARTRILTDAYTITSCSALTPVMFRHGTSWVKMTPAFSPADKPLVIAPDQPIEDINFKSFTSYAMGGIYDPNDLQQLRDFMMFSSRRDAMTSNIAHGLEGKDGPKYDITQILSTDAWKTLAQDRLRQMWGKFQAIGEVISGCVGIYFCIVIIKVVIGIMVRCFNIYKVTGMSWALVASVWSCFTQLVLSLRPNPPDQASTEAEETTIPLTEVKAVECPQPVPRVYPGLENEPIRSTTRM